MLAPTVVGEIERLLGEGQLSQRAIARRLGVSRGIVQLIAHGRRRLRREPAEPAPVSYGTKRGWERCPECGARVQMPCLLCHLRTARRSPSVCGAP